MMQEIKSQCNPQKPITQVKIKNLNEKNTNMKTQKTTSKKGMQIHDRWTKGGQEQGARH
jgi:hypothetical protein